MKAENGILRLHRFRFILLFSRAFYLLSSLHRECFSTPLIRPSARLRRLIGLGSSHSTAQRLKTALGEAEQFRHQPNDQRKETQDRNEHKNGMVEHHPDAAENGHVFRYAGEPVAGAYWRARGKLPA